MPATIPQDFGTYCKSLPIARSRPLMPDGSPQGTQTWVLSFREALRERQTCREARAQSIRVSLGR
jgi:hypothetical protein